MPDLRKIRGNASSRLLPQVGYDSRPDHAPADPDTPVPLFLLSWRGRVSFSSCRTRITFGLPAKILSVLFSKLQQDNIELLLECFHLLKEFGIAGQSICQLLLHLIEELCKPLILSQAVSVEFFVIRIRHATAL